MRKEGQSALGTWGKGEQGGGEREEGGGERERFLEECAASGA